MAVTLRLQRHGQTGRPYYRLVAAEHTAKRDGRFLEIVGTFNPMVEPPAINLKEDKIKRWLDNGARPSKTARVLIDKILPGYIAEREKKQLEKIKARRKARKAKASSKPRAAKKSAKKEKKSKKK